MGRAARANPRSRECGKPQKFRSFMICVRAARSFGDDVIGFRRWLDERGQTEGTHAREAMEAIWASLHPKPLVTIQQAIPENLKHPSLRLVR